MNTKAIAPVNPALRSRGQGGRFVPNKPVYDRAVIEAEMKRRAREWQAFRRDFLFSQRDLADALGVCRRTVCAIECCESIPTPKVQRLFRDLKRAETERVA
jgi:DNA-binding XRE family transcriptional regulator